jgi:hypothetical protein
VTKKYQKNNIDAPTDGEGFVVPERVSVAMAEIAGRGDAQHRVTGEVADQAETVHGATPCPLGAVMD